MFRSTSNWLVNAKFKFIFNALRQLKREKRRNGVKAKCWPLALVTGPCKACCFQIKLPNLWPFNSTSGLTEKCNYRTRIQGLKMTGRKKGETERETHWGLKHHQREVRKWGPGQISDNNRTLKNCLFSYVRSRVKLGQARSSIYRLVLRNLWYFHCQGEHVLSTWPTKNIVPPPPLLFFSLSVLHPSMKWVIGTSSPSVRNHLPLVSHSSAVEPPSPHHTHAVPPGGFSELT